MIRAGSTVWFAKHELRLAWRDWRLLMIAGSRRRTRGMVLGLIAFALFLHGFAFLMFAPYPDLAGPPDTHVLVVVTGMLALSFSLMLSQAMESVTRAFYARGDLDLILSSPVPARRLFAVRIGAMAVTVLLMTLVLAAPFINVLAWRGGAHWLGGYGVILALAMVAVAIAVILTVALFHTIGPRRTRFVSQILAAVIGAAFVIILQFGAILSYGTMSRTDFLQSEVINANAPGSHSILWWPARAVIGDAVPLVMLLGAGAVVLGVTIWIFAPCFGRFALIAAGVSQAPARTGRRQHAFRNASPAQALRRKEWALLRRDPWLASQTLLQLLYLLPPAFLCWRSFYEGVQRINSAGAGADHRGGAVGWRSRLDRGVGRGRSGSRCVVSGAAGARAARQDRGGDGRHRRRVRAVPAGAGSRLHHSPRWWRCSASRSPPRRRRQSSSGSAHRRSATGSGAARPRRASRPMPRPCPRSAGERPARWPPPVRGLPSCRVSLHWRFLPAPG